jgi:hypothetical protein
VREKIEYRFRVPSAAVFTLYSYSKALEYRFRVPTAGSLRREEGAADASRRREEKRHPGKATESEDEDATFDLL